MLTLHVSTIIYVVYGMSGLLLIYEGCLYAVGFGDFFQSAVSIAGFEEVVKGVCQVGALAEADAVLLALFCVEADGVGEAVVAGAFADHRAWEPMMAASDVPAATSIRASDCALTGVALKPFSVATASPALPASTAKFRSFKLSSV